MTKNRMEAFSDGVIAIIITIMVLELKAPHDPTPNALLPLIPVLLSYVLSFVFLGIYWSNHHHLLHAVEHVNGGVLWANLHLLFWLSLVPFVTAWMGENYFAPWCVAPYGIVIVCLNCLLYPDAHPHFSPWPSVHSGHGGGPRLQGSNIDGHLCRGYSFGACEVMTRLRVIHNGGDHVADT